MKANRGQVAAYIFAALLLTGCSPLEPINGCLLAAANRREVLRAQAYLHGAIPARLLGIYLADAGKHAALVYRLDGGWWVYDDEFGSRPLHYSGARFPDAGAAARAAFPMWPVWAGRWIDPEATPTRKAVR